MDTIYAVSSGAPPAAIAIVRISGAQAVAAATRLCGSLPPPRRTGLRAVRHPHDGSLLDRALVLVFPGPHSATGEDLVELHLHGGRAVVAAVMSALAALPGLRLAEAGEFTRRALVAGRIDLTEAEGLGDLLLAETEGQRRRAIAAAEGEVRRAVTGWSQRLLAMAAQVEAILDFSDEDDVAERSTVGGLAHDIAALAVEIDTVLAVPPVERLRDGVRVVLAGPPNAGKSTLLNALIGREAAIVSPIAGTTRDRIEAPVVRAGIAYLLIDTAGLATDTADVIEAIGIERANQAMAEADIVLWLGDDAPPARDHVLWLYPRADEREPLATDERLIVSARSGEGMDRLWAAIAAEATSLLPLDDQMAMNLRQRQLLSQVAAELHAAGQTDDLLLVAEHFRLARGQLDRITGATDVEAMLDTLFGKFCIGK